jgi:hypothetical protein
MAPGLPFTSTLHKAHYHDCLQECWANIRILETMKSNGDLTLLTATVKQFLYQHVIHANRSKPKNQQQNHAEHGSGTVEHHTHQMCPLAYKFQSSILGLLCWGCLQHQNHMRNVQLGWCSPLKHLNGILVYISPFHFHFWQHVWYWDLNIKCPSHQWWMFHYLGRYQNIGDPFTYWILTDCEKDLPCHLKTLVACRVHGLSYSYWMRMSSLHWWMTILTFLLLIFAIQVVMLLPATPLPTDIEDVETLECTSLASTLLLLMVQSTMILRLM